MKIPLDNDAVKCPKLYLEKTSPNGIKYAETPLCVTFRLSICMSSPSSICTASCSLGSKISPIYKYDESFDLTDVSDLGISAISINGVSPDYKNEINYFHLFEIDVNQDKIRKVLGSWYGGYTDGDSWRFSSGITNILEHDKYYEIHNHSGSVYTCYKNVEGMSRYTQSIFENYLPLHCFGRFLANIFVNQIITNN